MPSYLQSLFRQTLLDIARELDQADQEAFKFLCAGQVSASDREGKGLGSILNVFEKLEQTCSISCENVEFLRDLFVDIQRMDLLESKVRPFEFKRELLSVLDAYGMMKKHSGSKMERRSAKVAKRLVEETEGKIYLDNLLKKIDEADADVIQIVDRFIETTVDKKPTTWATVAMMVVFGAEVVCARESERESRLKEVTQTLGKHLMPWMSTHGGWNEFYAYIEYRKRTRQPDELMDQALEEIVEQFEAIELFQ